MRCYFCDKRTKNFFKITKFNSISNRSYSYIFACNNCADLCKRMKEEYDSSGKVVLNRIEMYIDTQLYFKFTKIKK